MIISHQHEFVFIHNPKAAGTAIRRAIEEKHDSEVLFWHQAWWGAQQRVVDLAHMTADMWTTFDEVEGKFVFGFVRNPYARFVSACKEFERRHSGEVGLVDADFVLKMLTPANIRYDWRYIHFCPQHAFFYIDNNCFADKICHIENFDKDWLAVNALLGNKLPAIVEPARVSEDHDFRWANLMSDERVRAHVNRLYVRDFLMFGYEMDGGMPEPHYSHRIETIHDPALAAFYNGTEKAHMVFTPGEIKSLNQQRGD